MAFTDEEKDEFRHLIQEEIGKAFQAGLTKILAAPINPNDFATSDLDKEGRNKNLMHLAKAFGEGLRNVHDDAHARIIEKTDPERATNIRNMKGEF